MESYDWGDEYFCQDGQARPFSGKVQRLAMREQVKYVSERKVLHPEKSPVRRKCFRSMHHKGQYG